MEQIQDQERRRVTRDDQAVSVIVEPRHIAMKSIQETVTLGVLNPSFEGDMSSEIYFSSHDDLYSAVGLVKLPEWHDVSDQEMYDQLMNDLVEDDLVGRYGEGIYFRPVSSNRLLQVEFTPSVYRGDKPGVVAVRPRWLSSMGDHSRDFDQFEISSDSEDVDELVIGLARLIGDILNGIHDLEPDRDGTVMNVILPRNAKISKPIKPLKQLATAPLKAHAHFPTFESFGGLDDQISRLRDFALDVFNPGLLATYNLQRPGAVLLEGPGGVGKTELVRAFSREFRADFRPIGGGDILNMWVGEPVRKLRDVFNSAGAHKGPVVVFIDEFDSLFGNKAGGNSGVALSLVGELKNTLNTLSEKHPNVMLMAAVNSREGIDPNLLRQGRFDLIIDIPKPDEASRAIIFDKLIHARAGHFVLAGLGIEASEHSLDELFDEQAPVANTFDSTIIQTHQLAELTDGFVGADIVGIIQYVAFNKMRREKVTGVDVPITHQDLVAAISYHRTHRGSDI